MTSYQIEQKDIDLLGTNAKIIYALSFEHASRHLVDISMEIHDIDQQSITVGLPVWMPGSYKIRDMIMHLGNINIYGMNGEHVKWHWHSKSSFIIETIGISSLRISYTYYANEKGVRSSHINRNHAYIVPVGTLLYVENRIDEIHHVIINRNPDQWPKITTALSPVSTKSDHIYGALNYHILLDSPIEIGNHQVLSFTLDNSLHELAIISKIPVDGNWLLEVIKRAVLIEKEFWGDLPYDRYVFFLLVAEGQRGGLEHLRCNVSAVEPSAFSDKVAAQQMMSLLVHEFFHTWNVKRIRPIELGPFDYTKENYTSMLWLAEGFTSYYDDYLSYRAGFYSQSEYLNVLAQSHLGRLARVPGRFAMSIKDSSYLAWVKLYSMSPDQNNRFPSYYVKGGIITLLLDMLIIIKSKGNKRLEHALQQMYSLYKINSDTGFTENQIIEIIENSCEVSIHSELIHWLNGKDELPYHDIFSAFGLQWSDSASKSQFDFYGELRTFLQKPETVFCGWGIREESGKLFIREIEEGTPSAEAGIGIDDEIIAINGIRVSSIKALQDCMNANGIDKEADIIAHSDGIIYNTRLKPIKQHSYSLTINHNLSSEQKHLLDYWLLRS